MIQFTIIFVFALAINVTVTFLSSDWYKQNIKNGSSSSPTSPTNNSEDLDDRTRWNRLVRKYLVAYLLATAADWLQGPYVYALYDEYGYKQKEIAVLFVAGFGSSMLFGSFVGGMADWGGRRTFVILYAIIYGLSCVTKHFPNFYVLMLGRLLGGVATSLLFSVFEAWLIRAHSDANLGQHYLSQSFAWAAYGNSVVAILAGLLADKAANFNSMSGNNGGTPTIGSSFFFVGGKLNPFDVALLSLIVCGVAATVLWEENYGDDDNGDGSSSKGNVKWYDGLKNAYYTTMRKPEIWLCGAISSLFEGSMYIFVFMWTPLMKESMGNDLPFGLIFSTFMVCCMAGTSWFSVQASHYKMEVMAVWVFGAGAAAMAFVALSNNATIQFLGMLCFEGSVGMYFPIMGTLKGSIVPEDKRAAIYNLFRIPLNFIVLFSLLTGLSPTTSFGLNALMLGTATVLMQQLKSIRFEQLKVAGAESDLLLQEKDETV